MKWVKHLFGSLDIKVLKILNKLTKLLGEFEEPKPLLRKNYRKDR